MQLEGMKELQSSETDTLDQLAAELDEKEKGLYRLQAELDDKVRFSKSRPEERRPAPEVADDRGFERAGPRRERAGEREQEQQERGGDRGGERGGGGGGGFRDREPREGGGFGGRGGGSFRDKDRDRDAGGRGLRSAPAGERRTPAW